MEAVESTITLTELKTIIDDRIKEGYVLDITSAVAGFGSVPPLKTKTRAEPVWNRHRVMLRLDSLFVQPSD